jgi:hypothetical protein
MKRWGILALVMIVVAAGLLIVRLRLANPSSVSHAPQTDLARTPNSAYKYNLCIEAFAYAHAQPDNPFKTDYTFHDPFRNANDTIIPLLMDLNRSDQTVSFKVKIIVGQLGTFTDWIWHVSALDGISVLLPDKQGYLQRPSVPQFIVSSLNGDGRMAVLDFTCAEQWQWSAVQIHSHRNVLMATRRISAAQIINVSRANPGKAALLDIDA